MREISGKKRYRVLKRFGSLFGNGDVILEGVNIACLWRAREWHEIYMKSSIIPRPFRRACGKVTFKYTTHTQQLSFIEHLVCASYCAKYTYVIQIRSNIDALFQNS